MNEGRCLSIRQDQLNHLQPMRATNFWANTVEVCSQGTGMPLQMLAAKMSGSLPEFAASNKSMPLFYIPVDSCNSDSAVEDTS